AADWPRVVRRSINQSDASCPVKGEPHFATLITSNTTDNNRTGILDIRWCVFFPVGKQPPGTLSVKLARIRRDVTINLHGFFFLDSERSRIDGLEERFNHNATTTSKSCVGWNGVIASQGTLAQLPEALASFAKQEPLDDMQCHELVVSIRSTWLW